MERIQKLLIIVKSVFPSSRMSKNGNILINFPSLVAFVNIKKDKLEIKISDNIVEHSDSKFKSLLKENLLALETEIRKTAVILRGQLLEENELMYAAIYNDPRTLELDKN